MLQIIFESINERYHLAHERRWTCNEFRRSFWKSKRNNCRAIRSCRYSCYNVSIIHRWFRSWFIRYSRISNGIRRRIWYRNSRCWCRKSCYSRRCSWLHKRKCIDCLRTKGIRSFFSTQIFGEKTWKKRKIVYNISIKIWRLLWKV